MKEPVRHAVLLDMQRSKAAGNQGTSVKAKERIFTNALFVLRVK